MRIIKTTLEHINNYRSAYFESLPEFQELFIELMIINSDFYLIQIENEEIGYAIRNSEGALIEFYVYDKYISVSNKLFQQVLNELFITEVYCKSFDSLLLSNCLRNTLKYSIIGMLYRDYSNVLIKIDTNIKIKKSGLSSLALLLSQDESIKVLFNTEQQLLEFIQDEYVFEYYMNDELIGCGIIVRTHSNYDFCDLGVWVNPSKRGNSFGSQIILNLRKFALNKKMKPTCGCDIENIPSQKIIEKSGFASKYNLINFTVK